MTKRNESHQMYELCKNHMHAYVLVETVNGAKIDGIITGLDEEYVYFALPIDANERESHSFEDHNRQLGGFGFGGGGYGYPGYGYPNYGYPGYQGYGRPRFKRLVLPLVALTALSILPWY